MAANKLKAPKNINVDCKPSPKQYELWKLLQPNYCPHCGGAAGKQPTASLYSNV